MQNQSDLHVHPFPTCCFLSRSYWFVQIISLLRAFTFLGIGLVSLHQQRYCSSKCSASLKGKPIQPPRSDDLLKAGLHMQHCGLITECSLLKPACVPSALLNCCSESLAFAIQCRSNDSTVLTFSYEQDMGTAICGLYTY